MFCLKNLQDIYKEDTVNLFPKIYMLFTWFFKAGVNLSFREKCDFLFFPENYPLGIKVNFWKTFFVRN